MKKLFQTALVTTLLLMVVGALLLPGTYAGAQTVDPSGNGGGVLPDVPTATPGLSSADATRTALAQTLPDTGSADATRTALAEGSAPLSASAAATIRAQGNEPLPVTGQPSNSNVFGYILLAVVVGFVLIMGGILLRRRRSQHLQ